MDTKVAYIVSGVRFNKDGEDIVTCKDCGDDTTMSGTKLCDLCWEIRRLESLKAMRGRRKNGLKSNTKDAEGT